MAVGGALLQDAQPRRRCGGKRQGDDERGAHQAGQGHRRGRPPGHPPRAISFRSRSAGDFPTGAAPHRRRRSSTARPTRAVRAAPRSPPISKRCRNRPSKAGRPNATGARSSASKPEPRVRKKRVGRFRVVGPERAPFSGHINMTNETSSKPRAGKMAPLCRQSAAVRRGRRGHPCLAATRHGQRRGACLAGHHAAGQPYILPAHPGTSGAGALLGDMVPDLPRRTEFASPPSRTTIRTSSPSPCKAASRKRSPGTCGNRASTFRW